MVIRVVFYDDNLIFLGIFLIQSFRVNTFPSNFYL